MSTSATEWLIDVVLIIFWQQRSSTGKRNTIYRTYIHTILFSRINNLFFFTLHMRFVDMKKNRKLPAKSCNIIVLASSVDTNWGRCVHAPVCCHILTFVHAISYTPGFPEIYHNQRAVSLKSCLHRILFEPNTTAGDFTD